MNDGEGGSRVTQFGRALEALIDIICTNSHRPRVGWNARSARAPQAPRRTGRRGHDTFLARMIQPRED
jgi:hypothetical protein